MTKLSPVQAADPSLVLPASLHLGPPAPPLMLPYHAGSCAQLVSPVAAIYFCTQFPLHSPYHQFIQFPVLHQSGSFASLAGEVPPQGLCGREAGAGLSARALSP